MSDDIFGEAFHDYLNGNTDEKIIVNMDISEPEDIPVKYFFRSYKEMPNYEKKVLNLCQGRVLDVGAGAGSHSLYLQQKGHEVIAIDISTGGVACMKQRGVKNVMNADFMEMKDSQFDTILFLMNGLGMAEKLNNLHKLLVHAASLLNKDGKIYLESTDILYMYEDEEGVAMINLAGKYYGEIVYQLEYKGVQGKPFQWLFVDFDNLSQVASLAGLKCELFFQGETDNYIACLYK